MDKKMVYMLKKIINTGVGLFGYKIILKQKKPLERDNNIFTMQKALERCANRGLQITTVVDVGSSDGRWSRNCLKTFPDANYLLVEAQVGHEEGLRKFVKETEKAEYILAAAGRSEGTIYFDNGDLFGGLASETPLKENCIEVPVVSLDKEVEKRNFKSPYLLKLDTHGFEVPILEGAKEIVKNAELIIIETYNYKLTNDSLKYFEMCSYMEKLGFSSIEMVDFMQRKYDNSFWQMDIFFVPSKNLNFEYNSYK
jgi:FkbM family methyltransferase